MEPQRHKRFAELTTITFLVERAHVSWGVALGEKTGSPGVEFHERLEVSCRVMTESNRSTPDFAARYPEGHVTLMPLSKEEDRADDQGYLHEGYVQQTDDPIEGYDNHSGDYRTLDIGLLVSPQYLTALATVLAQPSGPPVTLFLSVDKSRLAAWERGSRELLNIERASIAVGPFHKPVPPRAPIPARKRWWWSLAHDRQG
jgi:hypothetical protein